MLFTSPAFIFLFVPVMIALSAVTPQRIRRNVICVFSLAFYCISGLHRPASILFLLMVAAFTYCASYAVYSVMRRRVLVFAVSVPLLALLTLRVLAMTPGVSAATLPLGASFFLLSAISAVVDIRRGDAPPPRSFLDILLYITYFPVLIAGPVLRYKDFVRLSDAENIRFGARNIAGGIQLFTLGFIKRVAIAAVLNSAFEKISSQIGASPETKLNLSVAVTLGVILLVSVFFTFDGASDMGRGLSAMLGIPLAEDFGSCAAVYTLTSYANNFMHSLSVWFRDYVSDPLRRLGARRQRVFSVIAAPTAALCIMLWFRAGTPVLLALGPVAALALTEIHTPYRGWISRNLATRTLGRILTWTYAGIFWLMLRTQNVSSLVSALGKLTVAEPLQSYRLYITVLNREFFGVALLIAFVRLPVILGWLSHAFPALERPRVTYVLRWVWTFALLALFAATVAFVLPRYPGLANQPFNGVSL